MAASVTDFLPYARRLFLAFLRDERCLAVPIEPLCVEVRRGADRLLVQFTAALEPSISPEPGRPVIACAYAGDAIEHLRRRGWCLGPND